MVTGSIASGHYGQPRMTRDIDVVVQLNPREVDRLVAALGEEFMADADRIRSAIARRSMFNVIHSEVVSKIDFIVLKDAPIALRNWSVAESLEVDGHPIWIVSAEDLVLSKLGVGEGQRIGASTARCAEYHRFSVTQDEGIQLIARLRERSES